MLVERWAKGVLDKAQSGITSEERTFQIQGFRLDDFVLLAMPGEPFVEIGLGAKQHSTAATTMFVGPMFEYNWTHFSEIGQALSQIGNTLFMPVFDGMAPIVMPLLDPITSGLGISAQFTATAADGANIVTNTANAVSAGQATITGAASAGVPTLGGGSVPTLGGGAASAAPTLGGDSIPTLK